MLGVPFAAQLWCSTVIPLCLHAVTHHFLLPVLLPVLLAVLQVSVSHDAVAGGTLKQWEGLNMISLLPGMLVTARVRQVS